MPASCRARTASWQALPRSASRGWGLADDAWAQLLLQSVWAHVQPGASPRDGD